MRISDWSSDVCSSDLLTLVFTLGGWVLVPTVVIGWQPVTIISGSMAPTVPTGHVVMVEPYAGQDLGPGQVVTYRDSAQDRLVTHQVAAVDQDGTTTTKGENGRSTGRGRVCQTVEYSLGDVSVNKKKKTP